MAVIKAVRPKWPPKKEIQQKFEAKDYRQRLANNLVRTSIPGYSRTRRRSRANPQPLQGVMLMTSAEIGRLETFYDSETTFGNMSFEFPNPYYDFDTMKQPEFLTVAFAAAPRWTSVGYDLYRVRLNFEIQP